jgi:adenylyltransferase/sulfurtransferase
VPSCAEGGVLGILPGLIGCIQATECVKLILGKGEPLIGRLVLYDALQMRFNEFRVRRNKNCPICGDKPSITQLIDYEQFCGLRGQETQAVTTDNTWETTVDELKARLDRGDNVFILDVRTVEEYEICRIGGSTHLKGGILAWIDRVDPSQSKY